MESLEASSGWGVLHLFWEVPNEPEPGFAKRIVDAVESLRAENHQALCFSVLGHKADLGIMALGPDLARLQTFQHELQEAGLILVWSYVSLTELSEYSASEEEESARLQAEEHLAGNELEQRLVAWRERMAHYREHRLHPQLPEKRAMCFYPMSKRRDPGANWYALSFEERKQLMAGHARVGRMYAGRVLQLITGSTGLDDWEWGVTLLADDPVVLKEIVYEMRFDEVSVTYGEFGPFIFGLVGEPADVLKSVGQA